MKFAMKFLPLVMVGFLSACNTGGNNTGVGTYVPGGQGAVVSFGSKLTGQFVDAPVNGLNYYVNDDSSNKKRTTGQGNFTCTIGDVVTFLLGNVEIGKSGCGMIITPNSFTYADPAQKEFLLVTFQNMGGASGASLLDVGFLASQDLSALNFATLNAGSVSATYSAFAGMTGRGSVADFAAAATAAQEAMNEYISSLIKIPSAYLGKRFFAEVDAKLASGDAEWCDAELKFDFEAAAYTREDGSTDSFWNVYERGESGQIAGDFLMGPAFYFAVQTEDGDGTYMSTGAASISTAGMFSGNITEVALTGEGAGNVCVYNFGPISGEVTPYPESESKGI